jgi:ubiquinone/menaquinone biosynthesis C-methylase UbiE
MRGVEQIPWLYDAFMTVFERSGLERWRRWLVGGAKGRTLEVGSGTGRNLGLYPPDVTLVACEPAKDTLAKAKRLHPHALLVRASAEALPFRDGAFDTVVSSLVFCSVPRPEVGLAEVKRVLAKGGQLRMVEHVRSDGRIAAWLQDRIQPVWTWAAGGCHPNRPTEATVEAAGFVIQQEGRRSDGTMRRFVALPLEGDAEREPDGDALRGR